MADYAARIRAARGWADLTQQQLADQLGVDVQTIKRRESGSQEPKKGERLAIAAICKVPLSFMEEGFGEVTRNELRDLLERVEGALSRLGGAGTHPAPGGVLGQHAEGFAPSGPDRREEGSAPDTGAQRGSGG